MERRYYQLKKNKCRILFRVDKMVLGLPKRTLLFLSFRTFQHNAAINFPAALRVAGNLLSLHFDQRSLSNGKGKDLISPFFVASKDGKQRRGSLMVGMSSRSSSCCGWCGSCINNLSQTQCTWGFWMGRRKESDERWHWTVLFFFYVNLSLELNGQLERNGVLFFLINP